MNFKEYNHQTRLEENDHQEIKFKNDFFIRIKLLVRSIRRIQKRFIILNLLSILILISLIYLSLNSKPTKIKFETLQNKFSSSFSIEHQNNLLKPITREVLEKLNLLQNKLNQEDYQDDHTTIDQSNQKMPMVTSLPTKPSTGTHSSVSNNHLNIPAEELDRSICPNQTELGLPCSFLLPGFIGEQETKAQIHLHQLGLLAIQLNRTLVLPNVSKSRMGTCLNYPFDLYYQLESLNSLGIPTISYVEFINWTLNRFPYPTAQLVSILDSKIDHSDRTLVKVETNSIESSFPTKPDRNVCLNKGKSGLNFTSNFPITILSPERWNKVNEYREEFGETILKTLKLKESNVLVMNYDLRHPIYSIEESNLKRNHETPLKNFEHFQYAEIWSELANLMIENLTPYISIHWRQETLPIENLIKCSKSLIPKLLKIKKSFPSLNSIYFSTDYPIEEILNHKETFIAHSGTFSKLITSEHHLLMKRLIQEFKEIETDLNLFSFHQILNQMSLSNELIEKLIKLPNVIELIKLNKLIPNQKEKKPNLKQIVIEALNQLDLGLIGIIEKLIGIRSNVFLTGLPNLCSKSSSFTKQIVENRVKIIEQSRGGIMDTDYSQWEKVEMKEMKEKVLNVVEFWDAD
ncbi:hypothetical protein DFH28DRAFT_994165 [Melampsora americana]|nr:hypothetical protein DFH28DRAFT_994165 [Melampsora americana]